MSALTFPAWQSLLPDLVPRENLLNAIALNSAQFQSARLLGPLAAAGMVLLGAGMGEIFWVNAGSFLFVIAALWAIHPHADYEREADRRRAVARSARARGARSPPGCATRARTASSACSSAAPRS